MSVEYLARKLALGPLLDELRVHCGGFRLVDYWQQGEYHHDIVLAVNRKGPLPGSVLVVSTNCSAAVKEVLCFDAAPTRGALWHSRCPRHPRFTGDLPPLLAAARTRRWVDPCTLLDGDGRGPAMYDLTDRQPEAARA
jgi:hypothetical protein